MKKWLTVLLIIFTMVITLILLAFLTLIDYVSEEDIRIAQEKIVYTSPSQEENPWVDGLLLKDERGINLQT